MKYDDGEKYFFLTLGIMFTGLLIEVLYPFAIGEPYEIEGVPQFVLLLAIFICTSAFGYIKFYLMHTQYSNKSIKSSKRKKYKINKGTLDA